MVIIGAGPAGLAAGLEAVGRGYRPVIVEKTDLIGGKGASGRRGDFIVDFGPHAFHALSPELTDLFTSHGGGGIIEVPIKQRLYVTEKPMSFPLSLKEALRDFDPLLIARVGIDYARARAAAPFHGAPPRSFKEFGVRNFGKTLYNICFGDYSERVWNCSADTLSVEFAARKLPAFSLGAFVWELMTGRAKRDLKSYHHTPAYLYHREGIGRVFESMAREIRAKGGEVLLSSVPESFAAGKDNRIDSLRVRTPAGVREIHADAVLSTMPLDDLLLSLPNGGRKLNLPPPFRHGLIVNAVLERPSFSDAHWIYLVNRRFSFNRVSEPRNMSPLATPEGRTLLMFERICAEGAPEWRYTEAEWRPLVEKELRFFGIEPHEIGDLWITRMEKAFPFYPVGYEAAKAAALQELLAFPNLVSTGRYGLFLDIDMHDAMALGQDAVRYLDEGRLGDFYARHERLPLERRFSPANRKKP